MKNTYTVQRGNPITLECEVTGSPTHTSVYWTKVVNSQVVTLQMLGAKYGGSSVSSPSLIIFNAEDSDQGPYVCHATNGIGTGQSSQTYLNVEGCKYPLIILKSVIMKYWWLWIHFYLLNTDFDGFHWYHQSTKFVLYAKVNEHLIFCQSTKIDIKKKFKSIFAWKGFWNKFNRADDNIYKPKNTGVRHDFIQTKTFSQHHHTEVSMYAFCMSYFPLVNIKSGYFAVCL